jgi:DNA ligase-1
MWQQVVRTWSDIQLLAEREFKNGGEGLIIRDPNGRYKHGRTTLREGNLWKIKQFEEMDVQIVGFEQATTISNEAERTVDEFGDSKSVIRQEDRELVEALGAFVVRREGAADGDTFKVGIGFNWRGGDLDRRRLWHARETHFHQWCTISFQKCGMKDKPRMPVFIRFREDK